MFYNNQNVKSRVLSRVTVIITIHVPCESISELLPVDFHIQTNGDQHLRLGRILVDHRRIVVIEASRGAGELQTRNAQCNIMY